MFKKKEKTEKAPKNKKVRTMKVGTHKKSVLLLWAVLLASTSFGVYKNFTAIDTHTVHEKEIIQLRLNDTNGIENFVKNFAKAYYSWDTSKEAIEARTTEISKYLTKELQDLNADTIRTDIPTSATVTNVLVWNVEQSGTDDFTVAYEVDQQVKEGEQTQAVTENYTVTVHVDKDGAMVITQNPTLAPAMQKSKYEPKAQEADVSVSSDSVKDATAFLETPQTPEESNTTGQNISGRLNENSVKEETNNTVKDQSVNEEIQAEDTLSPKTGESQLGRTMAAIVIAGCMSSVIYIVRKRELYEK